MSVLLHGESRNLSTRKLHGLIFHFTPCAVYSAPKATIKARSAFLSFPPLAEKAKVIRELAVGMTGKKFAGREVIQWIRKG